MKIQDLIFAFFILSAVLFISSCGPQKNYIEEIVCENNFSVPDSQIYLLKDTTVNILSKNGSNEKKFLINADYIDTMSDPEKAALGYVSLFTLCQNSSEKNLSFLKKWFRYDKKISSYLDNHHDFCRKENEFEKIEMEVTCDTIKITSTIKENYPLEKKWMQEDKFKLIENYLVLQEENKTEIN